jgi:type I restriction enzyme, S subunit
MILTPVPHEWKTVPLRYVCQLNPSVDFSEFEEDDELTFLPMDRVKSGYFLPNSDKFSKYAASYNAFEEGDIVLAKVTPCFENGNIAVAQNLEGGKGFGSSELFIIRPKTVNRKFLFYYFQSSTFKQEGEASMTGAGGLKRVSPDLLRQQHLPCPNGETQRLIADYLDRETVRIDALVAEKEKMLALLEEKRAALISRTVTRGLDPTAPLKPSGLDWLGDIPAHWETPPVYARFEVQLGKMLDEKKIKGTHLAPYLRNVDVQWGTINTSNLPEMDFDDESRVRYSLQHGDILVCEGGEIGRSAIWFGEIAECYYQKALHRLRPLNGHDDASFFIYVMRTLVGLCVFSAQANAATIQHLPAEKLRIVRYPAPPIHEQREIVSFLNRETAHIKKMTIEITHSVELLKERRAALITAAVIGQIDIEHMKTKAGGRHEN